MNYSKNLKLIASVALMTAAFTVSSEELPAALKALEKQGVSVVGTFESKTGLKAYAATAGGRPLSFYVAPNGKIIVGSALDDNGQEMDMPALEAAVRKPLPESAWKQLESSRWIADGKSTAPRTVYVFTDPNCPYCAKLWADARPWVTSGKLQLRHVIVGMLTPTSRAKAAALLTAKNPGETLAAYEALHAPAMAKTLAGGGRPRPIGNEGLTPLTDIPAKVSADLDANEALMASLGMQATPGVVWRDANGAIQKRTGAPDSALSELFGPK